MSNLSTRIATASDLSVLASLFDLYRQFYEQAPDLALATAFIHDRIANKESLILLAEAQGVIVGFCQLYPTFCSVEAKSIYTLYDLFVAQSARKLGAGRTLMLAAEQHAVQNGFARMDLTTAKTNLPAQALYESLDWHRNEVFYAYSKPVQG